MNSKTTNGGSFGRLGLFSILALLGISVISANSMNQSNSFLKKHLKVTNPQCFEVPIERKKVVSKNSGSTRKNKYVGTLRDMKDVAKKLGIQTKIKDPKPPGIADKIFNVLPGFIKNFLIDLAK
jgi:hypothetical protein